MELQKAKPIADRLVHDFTPFCERVEIAGSIRRGKPDVKDIELVAIPRIAHELDMFGYSVGVRNELDYPLSHLGAKFLMNGPRFKQLALPEGIMLDLFLVLPPAQWGVLFTIRTGPEEFSKWCVTNRLRGGAMPDAYKCDDGHIVHKLIDENPVMPEELDFLNFLGLGWVEPSQRQARWWLHGRSQ